MSIINRILFLLLIMIIPSICILTAANITFRIPDIYRYELNRNGITQEINLEVSTDKLAQFFSDYMSGSLDNFQYTAFFMGRERPIFGIGEEAIMSQCRSILNLSLVALALMLFILLFIIWFLLWQKKKQAVRIGYYASIVLYSILSALLVTIVAVKEFREKVYIEFSVYKFEEADVLPQLFPADSFFMEHAVVIIIISLFMITFGYSIIKRLTYPDRMFY